MKNLVFLLFLCLFCVQGQAKVELISILGDHMVLQQQTEISLWGKATPGKMVVLKAGWDKKKYTASVDSLGYWKLLLPTPVAGGPYDIVISDGEPLTLKDVLIGEVWYCSGQSNMEMPLRGFGSEYVEHSKETIEAAEQSVPIRMFTVAHTVSKVPLDTLQGEWSVNIPEAVRRVSATAYFFAKKIQSELGIPVGIIVNAWGGTRIHPWMSKEALVPFRDVVDLKYLEDSKNTKITNVSQSACCIYNGMVHPLLNYKFRGMLWYQGESDHRDGRMYARLFQAFVKDMRNSFDCGEFPVYYAQIAPHRYAGADLRLSAELREAQMECMREIPNCGMAVLMDIPGRASCIHPPYKKEVGERLAAWALANTYGREGIAFCGPIYHSASFIGGMAVIDFDYAEDGLKSKSGQENIAGFELAGKDKVFHPAEAVVAPDRRTVLVTSKCVKGPIAVRYAFRNYIVGDLLGMNGLPASSFRSDDW